MCWESAENRVNTVGFCQAGAENRVNTVVFCQAGAENRVNTIVLCNCEASGSLKKPFRQHLYWFLVIFRSFFKPRRIKDYRLLRCFLPDSHQKHGKLRGFRPQLKTGRAENTGIYSVLEPLTPRRARVELKGGGGRPANEYVGGNFSVRKAPLWL